MDIPEQDKFQFGPKHAALSGVVGVAMLILVPFVNNHEGESLKSYQDIGGVWTACHGITGVQPDHKYTQVECDDLDATAKARFMKQVYDLVPSDTPAPTLAAYTSFAYNIGIVGFSHSSTLRYAREGDITSACNAMLAWFTAAGHDCRDRENNCYGLWQRRLDEKQLCLEGVK